MFSVVALQRKRNGGDIFRIQSEGAPRHTQPPAHMPNAAVRGMLIRPQHGSDVSKEGIRLRPWLRRDR
jgi:hypothetical protein